MSAGMSSSIGTIECRSMTAWVAKPETPRWCRMSRPSRCSRTPPFKSTPALLDADPTLHGSRPSVWQPAHCAAAGQERHDDPLAHGEVFDAGAEFLNPAGRLVPEQHGHRTHPAAVDDAEIRVADARGLDAHEHLARPRRIQFQLADRDRAAVFIRAVRGRFLPELRPRIFMNVTFLARRRSSASRIPLRYPVSSSWRSATSRWMDRITASITEDRNDSGRATAHIGSCRWNSSGSTGTKSGSRSTMKFARSPMPAPRRTASFWAKMLVAWKLVREHRQLERPLPQFGHLQCRLDVGDKAVVPHVVQGRRRAVGIQVRAAGVEPQEVVGEVDALGADRLRPARHDLEVNSGSVLVHLAGGAEQLHIDLRMLLLQPHERRRDERRPESVHAC